MGKSCVFFKYFTTQVWSGHSFQTLTPVCSSVAYDNCLIYNDGGFVDEPTVHALSLLWSWYSNCVSFGPFSSPLFIQRYDTVLMVFAPPFSHLKPNSIISNTFRMLVVYLDSCTNWSLGIHGYFIIVFW